MDRLAEASPCARSYPLPLSGVSGGSLGLAACTLASWEPASPRSSGFVRGLADEGALAANIAALFYRDGTHALHGLDYLYDRTVTSSAGHRVAPLPLGWSRSQPRCAVAGVSARGGAHQEHQEIDPECRACRDQDGVAGLQAAQQRYSERGT